MGAGTLERTLPAEVTSFVGRRTELAEVKRLLSASRLVTLTGTGGVGKTRLALRAAAKLRRAFPDGVCLVELAELRDPELLPQTVARAMGLNDRSAKSPTVAVRDELEGKQLLLVLDNCEHLRDRCADLVHAVLRGCPRLRVLTTSRQPLGLGGEQLFNVPPLAVPDPDHPLPAAEGLTLFEAVRLFSERAAAVVPGFAISESTSADVARLCQRLDGIPLAIELAARRLRTLSVHQILERLDDRYQLLTSGDRTEPRRQQTLGALIDWSFDLCSPGEQTLWSRASVFSGGFDLEAAESVCSGDEVRREDVLDLVAALVDKSVLSRTDGGATVRYHLPETLREYGWTKLEASGELAGIRRRHRDHYARLCERGLFGPSTESSLDRLTREHTNLRAAMEFCLSDPAEVETGLTMAASIWQFWESAGGVSEGRHWLHQFLGRTSAPSADRAWGLCAAAWLAEIQNDLLAARELLDESRALGLSLGNRPVLGYTSMFSGMVAMSEGDMQAAAQCYEDALAHHREAADPLGITMTLRRLALLASAEGDSARALSYCEECLTLCKDHDDRRGEAYALWALGYEAWKTGDRPRAVALERESIQINSSFGDQLGVALALEVLAWSSVDEDPKRAACLLGTAGKIWHFTESPLRGYGFLRDHHDRCAEAARHAVGDASFAIALREGESLTPSEALSDQMEVGRAVASRPVPTQRPDKVSPLTARETEIAGLVAQGMSNKEIAAALVISLRTAETHVEHILAKLGFTSRTQVATWLFEQRAQERSAPAQPPA